MKFCVRRSQIKKRLIGKCYLHADCLRHGGVSPFTPVLSYTSNFSELLMLFKLVAIHLSGNC